MGESSNLFLIASSVNSICFLSPFLLGSGYAGAAGFEDIENLRRDYVKKYRVFYWCGGIRYIGKNLFRTV